MNKIRKSVRFMSLMLTTMTLACVVMNIDKWYELFNVKRENTLYLPQEKRCYRW